MLNKKTDHQRPQKARQAEASHRGSVALDRLKVSGAEQLRKLQANDAGQVARGKRSAKSLHIVNEETLQGFTFKRNDRAESAEGEGW